MQKLEIPAFDAWYLKHEITLEEADSIEEVARLAYQAGFEAAQQSVHWTLRLRVWLMSWFSWASRQ